MYTKVNNFSIVPWKMTVIIEDLEKKITIKLQLDDCGAGCWGGGVKHGRDN